MTRRWIIRSFFISLLLLCVGGWILSSFYFMGVSYRSSAGETMLGLGTVHGVVWGEFARTTQPIVDGWRFSLFREPDAGFWPSKPFLGFGFGYHTLRYLTFPYWFLVFLTTALLWWVWRKTRLPVKGRAFPVEATSATDQRTTAPTTDH